MKSDTQTDDIDQHRKHHTEEGDRIQLPGLDPQLRPRLHAGSPSPNQGDLSQVAPGARRPVRPPDFQATQ